MIHSDFSRRLASLPLWQVGLALLLVCVVTMEWFYAPGGHFHNRLQRELFVWPLALLLMAGYVLLLNYFPTDRPLTPIEKAVVVVGGILITTIAAVTVPFHSTDVYGYINRGWQQVAYGTNPYVTVIKALPGWKQDAMLTNHWISNPCPYGFAFALAAKQLVAWGGGVLSDTLALFKLTNALVHIGLGLLLAWVASKTQVNNPTAPWKAFAEWTFHPLLLVHHLANGHNDVWMGALLAGAVALSLSVQKRDVWALFAITLSALMKYATVLVWPLWAVWLVAQRRWMTLLFGVLGSAATVWLLGLPYWHGMLTQAPLNQIVDNATLTHSSVHSLVYYAFRTVAKLMGHEWITLAPLVFSLVKVGLMALLGMTVLWSAQRVWKHYRITQESHQEPLSPTALLTTVWEPMLTVLCVGVGIVSLKFYPWYVGMVLPSVLMLAQQSLLRRAVMAVAVVQVLSITILGQARMADCIVLLLLPLLWVLWSHRCAQNQTATS
ncbi:MAG: hypothetical protein QE263_00690 [Vampirovibrionales bacterium]|nr:hypothetical protein [Vampirovibrionales bacterium]